MMRMMWSTMISRLATSMIVLSVYTPIFEWNSSNNDATDSSGGIIVVMGSSFVDSYNDSRHSSSQQVVVDADGGTNMIVDGPPAISDSMSHDDIHYASLTPRKRRRRIQRRLDNGKGSSKGSDSGDDDESEVDNDDDDEEDEESMSKKSSSSKKNGSKKSKTSDDEDGDDETSTNDDESGDENDDEDNDDSDNECVTSPLFNTGVDSNGNALEVGETDPHYIVEEASGAQAVVMTEQDNYIPNDDDSVWIWEQVDAKPSGVTRSFITTFELTGCDLDTATITGDWANGNFGVDIEINGISTGIATSGDQLGASFLSFTIESGFVEGTNSLKFISRDVGEVAGVRVDNIQLTAEAA